MTNTIQDTKLIRRRFEAELNSVLTKELPALEEKNKITENSIQKTPVWVAAATGIITAGATIGFTPVSGAIVGASIGAAGTVYTNWQNKLDNKTLELNKSMLNVKVMNVLARHYGNAQIPPEEYVAAVQYTSLRLPENLRPYYVSLANDLQNAISVDTLIESGELRAQINILASHQQNNNQQIELLQRYTVRNAQSERQNQAKFQGELGEISDDIISIQHSLRTQGQQNREFYKVLNNNIQAVYENTEEIQQSIHEYQQEMRASSIYVLQQLGMTNEVLATEVSALMQQDAYLQEQITVLREFVNEERQQRILQAQAQQSEAEHSAKITAMSTAGNFMVQLGQMTKCPELTTVGILTQASAQLSQHAHEFQSAMMIGQSALMISSGLGIAMVGMSLYQTFCSEGSQEAQTNKMLASIRNQIHELHVDMRQQFQKISNQIQQAEQNIITTLSHQLQNVSAQLNDLSRQIQNESQTIQTLIYVFRNEMLQYLQENEIAAYRRLCLDYGNYLQDSRSNFMQPTNTVMSDERRRVFYHAAVDLSQRQMHRYDHLTLTADAIPTWEMLRTVQYNNPYDLLGFLSRMGIQLLGNEAPIELNSLVHPVLWGQSAHAYASYRMHMLDALPRDSFDLQTHYLGDKLEIADLKAKGEKTIACLKWLSKPDKLLTKLIEKQQEWLYNARELIFDYWFHVQNEELKHLQLKSKKQIFVHNYQLSHGVNSDDLRAKYKFQDMPIVNLQDHTLQSFCARLVKTEFACLNNSVGTELLIYDQLKKHENSNNQCFYIKIDEAFVEIINKEQPPIFHQTVNHATISLNIVIEGEHHCLEKFTAVVCRFKPREFTWKSYRLGLSNTPWIKACQYITDKFTAINLRVIHTLKEIVNNPTKNDSLKDLVDVLQKMKANTLCMNYYFALLGIKMDSTTEPDKDYYHPTIRSSSDYIGWKLDIDSATCYTDDLRKMYHRDGTHSKVFKERLKNLCDRVRDDKPIDLPIDQDILELEKVLTDLDIVAEYETAHSVLAKCRSKKLNELVDITEQQPHSFFAKQYFNTSAVHELVRAHNSLMILHFIKNNFFVSARVNGQSPLELAHELGYHWCEYLLTDEDRISIELNSKRKLLIDCYALLSCIYDNNIDEFKALLATINSQRMRQILGRYHEKIIAALLEKNNVEVNTALFSQKSINQKFLLAHPVWARSFKELTNKLLNKLIAADIQLFHRHASLVREIIIKHGDENLLRSLFSNVPDLERFLFNNPQWLSSIANSNKLAMLEVLLAHGANIHTAGNQQQEVVTLFNQAERFYRQFMLANRSRLHEVYPPKVTPFRTEAHFQNYQYHDVNFRIIDNAASELTRSVRAKQFVICIHRQQQVQASVIYDSVGDSLLQNVIHHCDDNHPELNKLLCCFPNYLLITGEFGWTALHTACYFNKFNVALWLLNANVPVRQMNHDNQTALELAIFKKLEKIVILLIRYGALEGIGLFQIAQIRTLTQVPNIRNLIDRHVEIRKAFLFTKAIKENQRNLVERMLRSRDIHLNAVEFNNIENNIFVAAFTHAQFESILTLVINSLPRNNREPFRIAQLQVALASLELNSPERTRCIEYLLANKLFGLLPQEIVEINLSSTQKEFTELMSQTSTLTRQNALGFLGIANTTQQVRESNAEYTGHLNQVLSEIQALTAAVQANQQRFSATNH